MGGRETRDGFRTQKREIDFKKENNRVAKVPLPECSLSTYVEHAKERASDRGT